MAQHQVDQFKTGIWTVKNLLLSLDQLSIPDYQRPYKWTEKNLNALVNDIQEHKDKSAYRLGTIVLHHDKNNTSLKNINIVDGQQRTLTLILLVWAVIQKQQLDLKQEHLKKDLNEISNQINSLRMGKLCNQMIFLNVPNYSQRKWVSFRYRGYRVSF